MSSILIDRFKEADNQTILNLIADIISACIIISLSGNSIRCPFMPSSSDDRVQERPPSAKSSVLFCTKPVHCPKGMWW